MRLVDGLEADRERAEGFVEQSLAMGTVLAPEIGYDKAAALVKEAYATGRTVREVAREKSGIPLNVWNACWTQNANRSLDAASRVCLSTGALGLIPFEVPPLADGRSSCYLRRVTCEDPE